MNLVVLSGAAIVFTTATPPTSPGPVIPSQQQPGKMPVINPDGPLSQICPPTSRYEAARRGGPLTLRHLDELPGADMYKAVYRHIGGCQAPIIVRFDIGGRAGR